MIKTWTNQIALSFHLDEDATFANFYPGCNIEIVDHMQRVINGSVEHFTYLWGANNSGKTHLLQACCHHAHTLGKTAVYLSLQNWQEYEVGIFENLENFDLICLDDIQYLENNKDWQVALLHLYNRSLTQKTPLVVSANSAPRDINMALQDLTSRLTWGLTYHLHALSDDDKFQVLALRANARGLTMPEEVGQFLLRRCSRDMAEIFAVLERLDQASLAAQRRLTIPFVKSVLNV